jgi:hypothetical protein
MPMKHVPLILFILACAGTLFATVLSLTMCMAMGANSSPTALRVLKSLMIGATLLAIAGVTTGSFLLRAGHPGWALAAAIAPAAIMVLAFVVSLVLKL